jgi:CO/xanthine dehydrogenase Mo-binding subunit
MTKEELKFVGKSIPPMELLEKVTGRYLYVGDMPAELHAKILRSPYMLE